MTARNRAIGFVLLACVLAWTAIGGADTAPDRGREILLASDVLVSMDFQDALLGQVLKVFSSQTKLNFVASDAVKDKTVSLYLDQVTVKDALDTILKATGLTYELAPGSVFIVKESGAPAVRTEQRIFRLRYASAGGRKFRVTTQQEQEASSTSGGGEGGSSEQQSTEATEVEETAVKELIKPLLSKEYGQAVVDSRTNSLVVIDIPENLDLISKVIDEIDIKSPQVLIEAEILDTALNKLEDIGVTWGTGTNNARIALIQGPAKVVTWPFEGKLFGVPSFPTSRVSGGGVAETVTQLSSLGLPTATPAGVGAGFVSLNQLNAALDLLERDTRTKVLGKPKIMTLNNIPARIDITRDEAIASVTTIAATSGGLSTAATSQAERVTTGVRLRVTPQINEEDYITMVVEPQVIDTEANATFATFVDPRIRSVKTTVMLKDGDTLVIGGLVSTNESLLVRKVPLLGDLPWIGAGFRNKENRKEDRELLVFLTPHIVREEPAASKLMEPFTIEEPPYAGPLPSAAAAPAAPKAAAPAPARARPARAPLEREQEGLSRDEAIEQTIQGLP